MTVGCCPICDSVLKTEAFNELWCPKCEKTLEDIIEENKE